MQLESEGSLRCRFRTVALFLLVMFRKRLEISVFYPEAKVVPVKAVGLNPPQVCGRFEGSGTYCCRQ
jgi:hypothetical protein